jgi:CBS domain-containing protein
MLVRDFLQTDLIRIHPDANLFEAAEKLLAHNVETLLVFENDRFLGVIGLRDLFTAPIPAHYGNSMLHHADETQLLNIWKTITVRNLMNEKVLTVNEDAALLRALELMVNTGKHPLPVIRDGKVVGIISRMDIVRALLEQSKSAA